MNQLLIKEVIPMKKTAVMMSLILAVALMATAAFAGPWGGRFYGMGPMVPSLTPDQSQKVLALQQAQLERITPVQQELFSKKTELRSLWLTQNPDQAKINSLQKEIFDLVDQIQKESTSLRTEILKVINP
jgi:Spy/CpxP family protein refolding chaperone